MSDIYLGISYIDSLSPESIERFKSEVDVPGLSVSLEARPEPGPFATLEWLAPTAVVAYIAKPYFETFLKEMGKDHYALLKKGLKNLGARLLGKNVPRVQVIYTPGKIADTESVYSLTFSVVAAANERSRIKLLLQNTLSEIQFGEAIDAYLNFLVQLHEGNLPASEVKGIDDARPVGGTLLLAYDTLGKKLEVINPLPRREA